MTVDGMIGVVRSARSMLLTVAPDQHERRTFDMGRPILPPRPAIIQGDIAFIPLTRGLCAAIDTADLPLVNGRAWFATSPPKCGSVYAVFNSYGKPTRMHRLILGVTDPSIVIDHIDCNGLNNRRSNLRLSLSQRHNCANRLMSAKNTSGFKGVSWYPLKGKWHAQIGRGGKAHIGYFDNSHEAARAYDAAAIERYGEFAKTNVMLGLLPPESE